jgi:hypothetical protein
MRRLILSCLLILLSMTMVNTVSACSGRMIIDILTEMDVIVHATVLEVDDRGYNAILRVNRYFKGSGTAYLTVMRWTPAREVVADIRGYDSACTYDGGGIHLIAGSEGYFLLNSNGNGTYTDVSEEGLNIEPFIIRNGQVELYEDGETVTMDVPAFEKRLLELGDHSTPFEPGFASSRYPLRRFLTITTESGAQYQLNPDRSVMRLDEDYPLAISPDGSHIVFEMESGRIGFQYLALERKAAETDGGGWLMPQTGRAVAFSPNSNFAAVWDDAQFTVYMFDNYEDSGYGKAMGMQPVARTTLKWANDEILPTTVWSADSTTIAYQDGRGIWIWDIFEQSEPKLVVTSSSSSTTLLDISHSGRYVRFGAKESWTLIDTATDEIYINAIATPDESNLIFIQKTYAETTSDESKQECHAPLAKNCPIYLSQYPISDWFWYKANLIVLLSCYEEHCYMGSYSWQLAVDLPYRHDFSERPDFPVPLVNDLAYDNIYNQPVVATNDYLLSFGFYHYVDYEDRPEMLDLLDLTEELDSPIISVEWGQPIFYEHKLPGK